MTYTSPHLNVMVRAAEKAARSLIRDFGEVEKLQVSKKGPADFVSAADRRAEELIHEELSKARSGYGFLMEESGEIKPTSEDARWIVDPLDGTTNFLHGIPHWCISIALEEKGQITTGVIYDPVKDEWFKAEKNKGAFMDRYRLRVSGRIDPLLSTVACGAPRREKDAHARFGREYAAVLEIAPGVRRFGAAALDLAYVAAGRFDGFWERGLKIWDTAAGYIIVKEAGGFVTDLDKDTQNPLETGNILAGNEEISKILKNVLRVL